MTVKIGEICFEISFPLAAMMTIIILYDTTLSVVICFLSVIIHETGHLLFLRYYHNPVKRIKLTLFDIAIMDSHQNIRSTKQELFITLAGVFFNFAAALTAFLINHYFKNMIIEKFFYTNLSLGLFNLLPIDSLDGGQALYLLLSEKFSVSTSLRIVNIISLIILFPIAVIGFFVLLESKYNFSLLLTALYLITIILVKNKKN